MRFLILSVYLLISLNDYKTLISCGQLLPPNVFIEGCIDLTCLSRLSRDVRVNVCFDPLRKPVIYANDRGIDICCNVRQYQHCIFPLIIEDCGLDSIDNFEQEMRSVNAICNLVTLSWNKCQLKNETSSGGTYIQEV